MLDLSGGIVPPNKAMAGPGGKHRLLDKDGIAAPGERIMPSDIYVNKQSPSNTRDPLANPQVVPGGYCSSRHPDAL